MKNILLVSHGAALGGSPISALNVARFINKDEFRVFYAFGENGKILDIAASENIPTFVAKKRGFLGIPLILDYIKIIKENNIDIVHLNTLTSYYKYPAVAAKILKKPVVWFVRENPQEKRCTRLAKFINKFSDKIITVSYDTAQNMPYADKNKLMTIHNGIDLLSYNDDIVNAHERLNLSSKFKYISTIASIEKRKGILELVDAFSILKKDSKFSDFKLLIVGADRTQSKIYSNAVINRVKELNLTGEVIIYGESKMIKEIMKISEIFTLCSHWEGLSRVLLEAMACKKAIVCTDGGGNKEQVIDGQNGYVVDVGNVEDLALKLKLALSDGQKLAIFGENSRKFAEEKFDIKVTTKKIEAVYNQISR